MIIPKEQHDDSLEMILKINEGLKLSIRRLYEKMAANNEIAVVAINGEIKHIPAKELLEKHINTPEYTK